MSVSATEGASVNPGLSSLVMGDAAQGNQDQDMFLQLLVAQLRYQDPMNPADTTQFLSQNAQFTALEKMQDVADQTAQLLAAQVAFGASGLVGRDITWSTPEGETLSGTVDSVTFGPEGPVLGADGSEIPLAIVQSVSA